MKRMLCRVGIHALKKVDLFRHDAAFVSVRIDGYVCRWCGEVDKVHLAAARQVLAMIKSAPDMDGTTCIHPSVEP